MPWVEHRPTTISRGSASRLANSALIFVVCLCTCLSLVPPTASVAAAATATTDAPAMAPPPPPPPPPPRSSAHTLHGWAVEPVKLDGIGFSSAAMVLGRRVVVMGGVTPIPLPKPQGEPTTTTTDEKTASATEGSRGLSFLSAIKVGGGLASSLAPAPVRPTLGTAKAATITLDDFIRYYTTRAINLFDVNTHTVAVAKEADSLRHGNGSNTANSSNSNLREATLRQPAVGASSVVRIGSSAYLLGFCNAIPSFVNTTVARPSPPPRDGKDPASGEWQRVQDYLLSIQEVRLADVNATEADLESEEQRGTLVRVSARALPSSGTVLRYNATCVASAAASWGSASRHVIYIIGGVNLLTGEDISTVAQYDVEAGTFVDAAWSLGKPLVTPAAVSQSELIFIAGGYAHLTGNGSSSNGGEAGRSPPVGVSAYDELSVLDTASGVYRTHLLSFTAPQHRRAGQKPQDGEATSPMQHLGWTTPQVFVHGRTMVVTGVRGDNANAYSTVLVWDDMAAATAQARAALSSNGTGTTSPAHFTGWERARMEPHTGLLAPQRWDATLVAVPMNGELKIYLLGGLMPHIGGGGDTAAAAAVLSNDVFSATVAPADGATVANVVGISYAPVDHSAAATSDHSTSSSSNNNNTVSRIVATDSGSARVALSLPEGGEKGLNQLLGDASSQVLGYDTLVYNASFRVLLSANVSALCPGIDGRVEQDAANTTTSSTCSLLLSTSPDCDAPVAELTNLGPINARRETIRRPAKGAVWFDSIADPSTRGGNADNAQAEQWEDVFSIGDVYLTGSRARGLQYAHFTDSRDGTWAYKSVFSGDARHAAEGPGTATQTHLYVCLSTLSGTVAGCNAKGGPSDDDNGRGGAGNDEVSEDGDLYSFSRPGDGTRGWARSGSDLPPPPPLPYPWPPHDLWESNDGAKRAASTLPRPPPLLPHRYIPRRQSSSFCHSSFYVALNGAAPFLLQDAALQSGGKAVGDEGTAVSLPIFVLALVLLAVSNAVAVYVYRERFSTDPNYIFRCIDCASRGGDSQYDADDNDNNDDASGDEVDGGGRPSQQFSGLNAPQLRPVGRGHRTNQSWISKLLDKLPVTPDPTPDGGGSSSPIVVVSDEDAGEGCWDRVGGVCHDARRGRRARYRRLPTVCGDDDEASRWGKPSAPPHGEETAGDGLSTTHVPIYPDGAPGKGKAEEPACPASPPQGEQGAAPPPPPAAAAMTDQALTTTNAKKEKRAAVLDGKYKVLRRLGRGSFSVVYLVKRACDGKKFALKYVPCSDDIGRQEAMKECDVAYALQGHPNVIELVDMFMSYKFDSHLHAVAATEGGDGGEGGAILVQRVDSSDDESGGNNGNGDDEGGEPGGGGGGNRAKATKKAKRPATRGFLQGERYLSLVMAYHEEGDLGHYVRVHKQQHPTEGIPEATIVSIAFQVLSVLKFMHQRDPPIVHRDLKPENILLTRKIQYQNAGKDFLPIVLTDFGLSRVMDKTFCETGVGSLPYVAPECWQRCYTCKVDIWALGCILYAVMSKRVEADSVRVMFSESCRPEFHQKLKEEITMTLGYSERLARLVIRLLEMDPAARPTAEEALQFISTTSTPTTHPNATGSGGGSSDLLSLLEVPARAAAVATVDVAVEEDVQATAGATAGATVDGAVQHSPSQDTSDRNRRGPPSSVGSDLVEKRVTPVPPFYGTPNSTGGTNPDGDSNGGSGEGISGGGTGGGVSERSLELPTTAPLPARVEFTTAAVFCDEGSSGGLAQCDPSPPPGHLL